MDAFFKNLQGDSPVLQSIGRWGYKIYENRDVAQMSLHLLLAALFPIFIGSHASLRRPPSARALEKGVGKTEDGDDDEDDELDVEPTVEGLTPSDAIMFPILAGCTLGLLYFIIKWMEDPALLNKLLGYYFSVLGVFGIGKLIGDGLNVGTTFIFPNVWSSGKQAYHVDPLFSQQLTGEVKSSRVQVHRKFVEDKMTPLPGFLSTLKFSEKNTERLWATRALFKDHWVFRCYIHGFMSAKTKVQLNDVIGLVIGLIAIILYNATGKAWFLTNLMGFGFCYGTLQLLSPTTFWTGTLVLAGLFVYDIVMVFYTPMMVTVATKLDVPIKLVIPGKQGGMLGLGDIVLPGIMVALALRYDLFLHYLRKRTSSTPITVTPSSTAVATPKITKAKYVSATGDWGERFWTSAALAEGSELGGRFPKVYFYASIVGYIVGMSATLIVLKIYNHAQPALLYLVPGVLIALWGTAAVRGEVGIMWRYTEDGSLEDNEEDEKTKNEKGEVKKDEKGGKEEHEHAHHVFLFSLSAPKPSTSAPKKALLFEK